MFVDAPTLVAAHQLPAGDGALVQREGRDYCLHRTAVGHQGHDGDHQLVRFVRPVERGAFGFTESLGASFAAVASLLLAVDHDVALTCSAVGPATAIVAKSLLRVHMRILLLALNTNKSAAGPACSSTSWLNHGCLGCCRVFSEVRLITFNTKI